MEQIRLANTERQILTKNMKKWGMDVAKGTDNYEFRPAHQVTETIRKTFLDGGCTEIITTRRLERVVKSAIFGDRMKVPQDVGRPLRRGDAERFPPYEKIDVKAAVDDDAATTTGSVDVENNACPY